MLGEKHIQIVKEHIKMTMTLEQLKIATKARLLIRDLSSLRICITDWEVFDDNEICIMLEDGYGLSMSVQVSNVPPSYMLSLLKLK